MRVITGIARGKRIITLSGDDIVRPTPERVKEGMFSAIQFDIEGRRILDLFAGCGQLGIEALSRGAESATFVDASEQSISVVRKNLEAVGFTDKASVVRSDYASFAATSRNKFDVVFIDPPYKAMLFEKAINAVAPIMSDYGMALCEHPSDVSLPESISDLTLWHSYRYGKVCVDLYRKRGELI